MIDTHAHIYLDDFEGDIEEVVQRAKNNKVDKILLPNIDKHSIQPMLHLEEKFKGICYPMMGLHPCYVKEDFKEQLGLVKEWLEKGDFLAVGEMGTDLFWDKGFWKEQEEAFHFQCGLALEYDLPIVVHCRDSIDETINLVSEYKEQGLRGVFHCFTGTAAQGKDITEMGFYLGIGGVVTFKNGGMQEVIPKLDLSRLILETDSPYLTPAPYRGKRNEPAYVKWVADKMAEYLGMTADEIDKRTTLNANDLFFPTKTSIRN